MRAVQIAKFGGPEVLQVVDVPAPEPEDGQVSIRVSRAGINFADTHQRENSYLASYELPLVPGAEVAGTVEREGEGFEEGQRVVALLGSGGYAERAVAPAATTFPVPDELDDGSALALVLQGLTAWHILRTSAKLEPGETVVVHAAAGGVGSFAMQLARLRGATVIGTASEGTHDYVRGLGAEPVTYGPGLVDRVRALVPEGVTAVLDLVGGDGALDLGHAAQEVVVGR